MSQYDDAVWVRQLPNTAERSVQLRGLPHRPRSDAGADTADADTTDADATREEAERAENEHAERKRVLEGSRRGGGRIVE